MYAPADDLSRLKRSGKVKVVILEVAKECRGGTYITVDDLAPHGEESVEFLVSDELFYHAGDLTVPAQPDSGRDISCPGEMDLGALERDLLEYQFSEDDDGEVDGNVLLMTPSSFMSPTKEAAASLSSVEPISLAMDYRRRELQKLLHESPRRRNFEESMRISFLSTLPEEEWERYQSELERETGVTWNRVTFMERAWDVIRRYRTQSIMKVGLNQPIMREVLEKIVS